VNNLEQPTELDSFLENSVSAGPGSPFNRYLIIYDVLQLLSATFSLTITHNFLRSRKEVLSFIFTDSVSKSTRATSVFISFPTEMYTYNRCGTFKSWKNSTYRERTRARLAWVHFRFFSESLAENRSIKELPNQVNNLRKYSNFAAPLLCSLLGESQHSCTFYLHTNLLWNIHGL